MLKHRSSCEGYLTMRTSPSAPPPMVRRYCVIIGTTLTYYSSEDDAQRMMNLKGEVDVIGVQEWDGKGNVHIYVNSFLFATSQSKMFYAYADNPTEKEKWLRAIQMNVERTFPVLGLGSSILFDLQRTPELSPNSVGSSTYDMETIGQCGLCSEKPTSTTTASTALATATTTTLTATSSSSSLNNGRNLCYSCEGFFCDKHTANEIPLPQCNFYSAKRVCDECYNTQRFINFLKGIVNRLNCGIYLYPSGLDPDIPIELLNPSSRPSHTEATNLALGLFKNGKITAVELEELLNADQRFQDLTADDPEIPLDLEILALHRELGDDDFTVSRAVVLLHTFAKKNPLLYKPVVEKLLVLSYTHIDDIEFYWPQISYAYLRIPIFDFDKMFWLGELILSICSRSIHLALLLMWQLQGSLEDSLHPNASKEISDKYPRTIYLMMEIEVTVANRDRLSIFSGCENKRQRPPKAVDEQINLINTLLDAIDSFRDSVPKPKKYRHTVRDILTINGIECGTKSNNASTDSISMNACSPLMDSQSLKSSTSSSTVSSLAPNTLLLAPHQDKISTDGISPVVQDVRENESTNVEEEKHKEILDASCQDTSSSPVDPTTSSSPINPTTSNSPVTEDTKIDTPLFSDFSLFQQHLLTPSDVPGSPSSLRKSVFSVSNKMENVTFVDNPKEEEGTSCSRRERALSEADKNVLASYFTDEMDFIDSITAIAERLRFVQPVSERKCLLPGELSELHIPEMAYIPLIKATDSYAKIIRIPPKEATAFSTKARVPIMVIFEVLKGGGGGKLQPSPPTSGNMPLYDVDDEVGELIDHHNPNDFSNLVSGGTETVGLGGKSGGKMMLDHSLPSISPDHLEQVIEDHQLQPVSTLSETIKQESTLTTTPSTIPSAMPSTALATMPPGTPPTIPSATSPSCVTLRQEASSATSLFVNRESLKSDHVTNSSPPLSLHLDLTNLGELSEEVQERDRDRKKDLEAAFGESWQSKRSRLQKESPFGHLPGWEIVSMIAKSNDDLRQEVFTLQVMQKFLDAFKAANLPMWLNCYRIISTSSSTGLIETLINAISLDGLKKREGYTTLVQHFEKSYGPSDGPRFIEARSNFIRSMASYSLVCYFLQIKDRHNGNIMIDNEGHIIHIDFGFILGIAPGGSFSLETAPFKLTAEMVETMGGVDSDSFKEYVNLCTRGFIALQQRCNDICSFVELMAHESSYPCFQWTNTAFITSKLRSRFKLHYSTKEVFAHVLNLIRRSNGVLSTRQYDTFQRMTNGIMP